jgi:hypothetical protein
MGAMAMMDMDREQALNEAHVAYLEAFQAVMDYLEAHDINRRTLAETEELCRLNSICGHLKYQYEIAQMQRYRVVI